MRRLTLILSDLYLPEEAGRGAPVPTTHDLPNLEWLLRFADAPEQTGDWRRWLLEHTPPGFKSLSVAGISGAQCVDDRDIQSTWLATPVALEARLDHVRLLDRGLLRLDEFERASCREEFSRIFGPTYQLRDGGERALFLTGLPAHGVRTIDPARLLGNEIGPSLPGREAGELRRLWAEIEMWMHGAAFNSVRERAGRRRVSALWIWGGDPLPGGFVAEGLVADAYLGADPLIVALSRMCRGGLGSARSAPKHLAEIDPGEARAVVEFAPLTGASHESLEALDLNWFAPAKSALVTGDIQELDLIANDRCFRIRARGHWKFWRRRRPWLASLAS
jgi:hypothetical protein